MPLTATTGIIIGVFALTIAFIVIIIYYYYRSTGGGLDDIFPTKAALVIDDFNPVANNTVIDVNMLDPGIAKFWPAFEQHSTEPGSGIPPEFWNTTKTTTYNDCQVRKGLEVTDCTIDPLTLPNNQYPGGRAWHMAQCVPYFGGSGICKPGTVVGSGIPGLIRNYTPDASTGIASDLQCMRDCKDDPNCAFTVYSRRQSQYSTDQSLLGGCKHYSKEAYPFRVKMGYPNEGVYTMNIKKTAQSSVDAVDQAVKSAQQKALNAYNLTLGELVKYTERVGDYIGNGCFTGGMRGSDNDIYAPITNWLPVDDVYGCARICSGYDDCKSFVYDSDRGCILSGNPDMYIMTNSAPSANGLSVSNNKIRCGANYYTKK